MKVAKKLLPVFFYAVIAGSIPAIAGAVDNLGRDFENPPESVRPLTFWHWMNGLVGKEGITADLEAIKRAGLGGVLVYNIGGRTRVQGDVKYMSDEWFDLMKFSTEEAKRVGLDFSFHNCPGWSSSGGPWITPELSMQQVVWSETKVEGGGTFEGALPLPKTVNNFYRDIAVLAIPAAGTVRKNQIIDVTPQMTSEGKLTWQAPPGKWVVLRFGHTSTGKKVHPTPVGGEGLECDKMNPAAVDLHFNSYAGRILENSRSLVGDSIKYVEIDSYEAGGQNWTPGFRETFQKRNGYDIIPWLPVLAKRTVASKALSERFEWDLRETVARSVEQNYFGEFARNVHRYPGLKFASEPYGTEEPFDTYAAARHGDLLLGEFWQGSSDTRGWKKWLAKMTSASAVLEKTVVGAEAFTGEPWVTRWSEDPYALKSSGDYAFSEGINLLVLHSITHQPWKNAVPPGIIMQFWGTHFGRMQTWWDISRPWFDYLSRCQYLLRQGRPVVDILKLGDADQPVPPGYKRNTCGVDTILRDLQVMDGVLTLPHGQTYRVLILDDNKAMTPELAGRLRDLVNAGAYIIGSKPAASPSLINYPGCDGQVQQIAAELWDGKKIQDERDLGAYLAGNGIRPDFAASASNTVWNHRRDGNTDIYFVSNQSGEERVVECTFRVTGKIPELWDASTGKHRAAASYTIGKDTTTLPLKFDPSGSVFVIFRNPAAGSASGGVNWPEYQKFMELSGSWTASFDPAWGGPGKVDFLGLEDWTKRPEPGIRYYSGTAVYETTFDMAASALKKDGAVLDLGRVKNLAQVELNGKDLGILWKPPFRVSVGGLLKAKGNRLVVRITNLWPNRLIGDEQDPPDLTWGKESVYKWLGKEYNIGRPLTELPDWFVKGQPRPSQGRFTFTSWNYYDKESPLLESGLLGPVTVLCTESCDVSPGK